MRLRGGDGTEEFDAKARHEEFDCGGRDRNPTGSYIRQLEEQKAAYQSKLRSEVKKNNDLRVTCAAQNRRLEQMRKRKSNRSACTLGEKLFADPNPMGGEGD